MVVPVCDRVMGLVLPFCGDGCDGMVSRRHLLSVSIIGGENRGAMVPLKFIASPKKCNRKSLQFT